MFQFGGYLKHPDDLVYEVLEESAVRMLGEALVELWDELSEYIVFGFAEDTLLNGELDPLFPGVDEVFARIRVLLLHKNVVIFRRGDIYSILPEKVNVVGLDVIVADVGRQKEG
jgi:hypothetical protein